MTDEQKVNPLAWHKPYQQRIAEYEQAKKKLPPLNPREYELAIKILAEEYGI